MKKVTVEIPTDSEARLTYKDKTHIFTLAGYQGTSVGGSATLEELEELRKAMSREQTRLLHVILGAAWNLNNDQRHLPQ